jgi:glycosyltransferase involved in cell wall biosynthesis
MPSISAILHTHNDELRIGRALGTLHPCDEILIVDHGSTDRTLAIVRQYAARILRLEESPVDAIRHARHDWLLCLHPNESLSESLEATLFEWRHRSPAEVHAIVAGAIVIRTEAPSGWSPAGPETRLVPKTWTHWQGPLPVYDRQAIVLQGDLLRFRLP